jgi:hypothetical protein
VLRERDYGALDQSHFSLFVQFFRQASPYIEGHRGRTFVLAIPGEVHPLPASASQPWQEHGTAAAGFNRLYAPSASLLHLFLFI